MAGTGKEDTLAGVVLAGGKSSRLGQDKARILVSGQELIQRTVHLLSRFTKDIWIIGRDPGPMTPAVSWKMDDTPGQGPAGGICTALRATGKTCLVVSCDLPFLDSATLETLLEWRAQRRPGAVMTTFQQVETGFIESLVAVYEPAALELLDAALAKGDKKLSRAVSPEQRQHIPYTQDAALPFFNINYPAELALMRKLEQVP